MTVYDSARARVPLVEEFFELVRYRELLAQLVSRNIKTRYKRSVLGVAWTMLNPLLLMTVMSIVFSGLFRFAMTHYPVYVLAGLLVWNFFSQTTLAAMTELVWGGSLLSRIYVPRAVFAVSALGTGLVNLLVALIPLLAIMLILGAPVTPALLFLPVSIALLAAFTLGVSLLLSALAIDFPDTVETYSVILSVWIYLTPVIYPIEIIGEADRWWFQLNPMYALLNVFRVPIYLGQLPDAETLIQAAAVAFVALAVGWWVFTRKTDAIAYRV